MKTERKEEFKVEAIKTLMDTSIIDFISAASLLVVMSKLL
jgi:hypothetical protein